MTDYSQLSDFEINHRVAKLIGLKLQSSESLLYNTQGKWEIFDPCCNPADAWPIIQVNNISLVAPIKLDVKGEWIAYLSWESDECVPHVNPLRAGMIAFLMMKDTENADS